MTNTHITLVERLRSHERVYDADDFPKHVIEEVADALVGLEANNRAFRLELIKAKEALIQIINFPSYEPMQTGQAVARAALETKT